MNKHLLAFVTDKNSEQVFLHADQAGVDYLIERLKHISEGLKRDDCPHTHLFSEDWGGGELSSSTIQNKTDEGVTVHHLKILGWNEEWVQKLGFTRS